MKRLTPVVLTFLTLLMTSCSKTVLEFRPDAQDHVGAWGAFKPNNVPDWHWVLKLKLDQAQEIKSIIMLHAVNGEAWSTSSDYFYDKSLYSLGVFLKGKQLNSNYDQSLGNYEKGLHTFDLFGERGGEFMGSKAMITLGNGNVIDVLIRSSNLKDEIADQIYSDIWKSRIPLEARRNKAYFTEADFPTCSEEAVFNPGKIWNEMEGPWQGVWTRRGDTNIFDAHWISYAGEVSDEMELVSVDKYYVKLLRKGSGGFYHGILSCDKKSVTKGTGDGFSYGGYGWEAKITP